jgi:hypothetical protein
MIKKWEITEKLMEHLIEKYDAIIIRIGDGKDKEEAFYHDGKCFRLWFDPLDSRENPWALEMKAYSLDPKTGRAKNTFLHKVVKNDSDVEEVFKEIWIKENL